MTGGIILRTTDGGTTWTTLTFPEPFGLDAVSFSSASNGIVTGTFGIMLKTNDGGLTYKVISSGALALPTGRNANAQIDPLQLSMQEVLFANSVSYTSYRLTFNHTKNDQLANSMQISEIELLGTTAAPSVNLSFSRTGSSLSITSSAPGTLQSTTALNGANTVWVNEGPISGTRVLTIGAGIKLFRVLAQ